VYVWESIAVVIGRERVTVGKETYDLPTNKGWAFGAPVLVLAFIPLFANWTAASRAGQTDSADIAIDMLNSVAPYGILVTAGDNDTFPLWYAQEVLGIRKDVTVANTSLLNTDWYTRQMIRREVFEYDAEAGPEVFRGREWPKPSGPALKMTFEEADRLPLYEPIQIAQTFRKGEIVATIEPQVLQRADILVLRMILDNDTREIHFSRTAGGLPQQLGLQDYVVMQGHTRRLLPRRVQEGNGIVRVPGEGFVDVATSASLWREFKAPTSLAERTVWHDIPSINIPGLVVNTGIITAEALARSGNRAAADSIFQDVREVAVAMRFNDLVAQLPGPQAARPGSDSPQAVPLPPQ
jgi:hypothetical protein